MKDPWLQRTFPLRPAGPRVQELKFVEMLLNPEQALVLLWLLAFLGGVLCSKGLSDECFNSLKVHPPPPTLPCWRHRNAGFPADFQRTNCLFCMLRFAMG